MKKLRVCEERRSGTGAWRGEGGKGWLDAAVAAAAVRVVVDTPHMERSRWRGVRQGSTFRNKGSLPEY